MLKEQFWREKIHLEAIHSHVQEGVALGESWAHGKSF